MTNARKDLVLSLLEKYIQPSSELFISLKHGPSLQRIQENALLIDSHTALFTK